MSIIRSDMLNGRRGLLAVAVIVASGIALATTAPVQTFAQNAVMRLKAPLETRFPRACLHANQEMTGIVVLGGNWSRTREALRLAALLPRARLVFTGLEPREEEILVQANLPADRVAIERRARNTFENAVFAKMLADPQPGERWLLVTSALHMPRAQGTFAAAGFRLEPWAIDDSHPQTRYAAQVVLYEVLGLIGYRLTGRSRSFFPSPSDVIGDPPGRPNNATYGTCGLSDKPFTANDFESIDPSAIME